MFIFSSVRSIYVPAQRELDLGLASTSVMCTTTETRRIKGDIEACKWASCSEWCLSKGGGDCTHLYVTSPIVDRWQCH